MRQPMRDVGIDGALALNDLIDAARWNADVFRQVTDAYSSRSEELLNQNSARVYL